MVDGDRNAVHLSLHADGLIGVRGLGQTRVDSFFSALLLFLRLLTVDDLESAVQCGEHQSIQEEDSIQNITDLWFMETCSCSPEAHPQRNGHGQWTPAAHADEQVSI